jgi:hypothetical protein
MRTIRSVTLAGGVILTCGWWSACSSASQNVTSPSTLKCQVTAVADPARFAAGGGGGTLTVSANRECSWSATSSDPWLQVGAGGAGQGTGTVPFNVAANGNPAQRGGGIAINGQEVAIRQDAAACTFTVPAGDTVSSDGERRSLEVAASGPECSWTARSETEWLAIVQGTQGSGSGQVVYEARATEGPSRSGELTIAGHRVAVTQGLGCSVAIAPASQAIGAAGGSGAITVTTDAACPWSAQSQSPWISITSAAAGTGPATVQFRVAAWDGPTRTGTLRIDQQVFTVTQGTGCVASISPESSSIASTGGSGTVAVTTAAGCEWKATSSASWITISGNAGGTGSGSVQFAVAPTTGPARNGTLTAAGRTFAIGQRSGCTFSIGLDALSVAAAGGSGTVPVTAIAGCEWTAATSASWITIASGSSGNGNGAVQLTVAPTNGPARSATVTIAGRAFAVSQSSGCSVSISPASHNFPWAGGSVSFAVSTAPGCTWTAASAVPWVRITAGESGAGPGAATFTADETPSSLGRSGAVSIAGQPFGVSQEGAPCAYVLGPSTAAVAAGGASGTFEVNTKEACTWSARSNEGWLRVTAGGSGTGDGNVSFSADPNAGAARMGTIVAGGLTFTVSQAGTGAVTVALRR